MHAVLNALDNACGFMPPALRIGVYGLITGVVAMLIYWLLSPQRRIRALKAQIAEAQRAMRTYAGNSFGHLLRLSGRAVWLPLRLVLLVGAATVVAGVPVLLLMAWLDGRYGGGAIWPAGPHWLCSWHATFMLALMAGALAVKFRFRIA